MKIFEELDELDDKEMESLYANFVKKNGALADFVFSYSDGLGDDLQEYVLTTALGIWLIVIGDEEKELNISEELIEQHLSKNQKILDKMNPDSDSESWMDKLPRIDLVHFILEELFDEDESDDSSEDKNAGVALLILLTTLTVLDSIK